MTTPAARRPPPWLQVVWGPYLAAAALVQHRTEDGSTTVTREGGAGAWVLVAGAEGARYDFIRGFGPSFPAAHTELVRRARVATNAVPWLDVRCGVGDGNGRKCGALLGTVVRVGSASPVPAVWRPADASAAGAGADPATTGPGALPLLLVEHPAHWNHFCVVLAATCPKHGPWLLDSTELLRRCRAAERGAAFYIDRVAPGPLEQGPLVTDPRNWTPAHVEEALAAVRLIVAGTWPPAGVTAVKRSQIEARVLTLCGAHGPGRTARASQASRLPRSSKVSGAADAAAKDRT